MKNFGVVIVILLIILIVGGGWFFGTRNNLIGMDENIKAQWAQVENQMQRRYDLIPNLVNTVKGYAKHEKDIFIQIAEARAKLAGADTVRNKIRASNSLEGAIGRLLLIVENYPTLKANENFSRLMDELAGAENRLAVARKSYNEAVQVYNRTIRMFPASIVATISDFEKADYFQVEEIVKSVPTVNF
ncbi:MAG: LemA family protein [Candidatus Margulisiibacteriota bacterium]